MAYKVEDAGVFTNFASDKVQMHSVTVADAHIGAGAMISVNGAAEYKHHASYVYDSIFYGYTISPDCPDENKQCSTVTRAGVTTSI